MNFPSPISAAYLTGNGFQMLHTDPQYKYQNFVEYCKLVKSRWLNGLGICSVDGDSDWKYSQQLETLMSLHTVCK